MYLPLDLSDLTLFFGANAMILLVASELLLNYSERSFVRIDRRRLRNVAIAFSFLFLINAVIELMSVGLSR